jgi:N-acetylmuramoyl-L-alanine amidase
MNKYWAYCVITSLFFTSTCITGYTVILDPGHGGIFSGGRSNNVQEKDITLQITLKVADLLKDDNNVHTVLTRTHDIHLDPDMIKDLQMRAHFSHAHKADLFISIHANTGGKNTRGYEVYVPFNKKFPAASYQIASFLHHELSQFVKPKWGGKLGNLNEYDRGIRAANFHVLRGHNCPALLLELDFITNKLSLQNLQDPIYQNKLAEIIVRAIREFKNY